LPERFVCLLPINRWQCGGRCTKNDTSAVSQAEITVIAVCQRVENHKVKYTVPRLGEVCPVGHHLGGQPPLHLGVVDGPPLPGQGRGTVRSTEYQNRISATVSIFHNSSLMVGQFSDACIKVPTVQ
jgi:hypothetical protein